MPAWNDVLNEIKSTAAPLDAVRRKYLKTLNRKTKRNVICYYSGWLQGQHVKGVDISDLDKNGFMNAIYGLDRSKGLDVILHTPGGGVAATESIVDYLRQMFGKDIRAIVPQIAMSAGTMIACSCKSIVLGKQSNLGPVDPQFNGIPAQGVVAEFKKAIKETKRDPGTIPIWQAIIGKYHPTFVGQCEKAIDWSQKLVIEWLKTGMFEGVPGGEQKSEEIVEWLSNHELNKTHSRHISAQQCIDNGLKIERLEELPNNLQDTVLTIHHAYMHTFSHTDAIKIIENHKGKALVTLRGAS